MKRRLSPAVLAAAAAFLMWLPVQSFAQGAGGGGGGGGRGNFDPAEMRQRMMDRYKELLDVKSDDEWKVIEPRITKVTEARTAANSGMGRGMFGRGGRGPGGGGGGANADTQGAQGQGRRGGGGFGGQPSVAAQELQKAIDDKASAETIKTKLTAYREDRQEKHATLEKAQEELKKVLSVRQEAAAVLAGLLE